MKKVNVAIMGFGTVGAGAYELLTENHDAILENHGIDINVAKVLDKRVERFAEYNLKEGVGTTNLDDILLDPTIEVVVEVMGGVEPALTFITKALKAGKNVVSANKELIAKQWTVIDSVARENNVGFYHEASCVGGVPVIRVLNESLQGDNLVSDTGIINGTTNYILTKMTEEGISYDEALAQAQKLGYAEFNPTADVEGYDAMYKLSILSSLAFKTCIPYTEVSREGITQVSLDEIEYAKKMGYVIKLLAIGTKFGNKVEVRVHPTAVKQTHPLGVVNDSYNAVVVKGDFVDNVMLYGRGAGARPTGSAIVSDIIYCIKRTTPLYPPFENNGKLAEGIEIVKDSYSKYFVVLSVKRADADKVLTTFIEGNDVVKEYKYDLKSETLTLVTKNVAESKLGGILNSIKDVSKVLMNRKAVL
jgi:homoserine dehydrogenase